jgi:hypothetical protein
MGIEVFCFYDGSFSVCIDGKPLSNGHWSKVIAEQLQASGHNPAEAKITLANGLEARFQQASDKSWCSRVVVGQELPLKKLSPSSTTRRKNGKRTDQNTM